MDPVKEAFTKVKQDIKFLQEQITQIHEELQEINRTIPRQTDRHINQTDLDTSTDISTHNMPLEPVSEQFPVSSIGNEGVSTDRQTIRQTDNSLNQAENSQQNTTETHLNQQENAQKFAQSSGNEPQNQFNEATEAIAALEAIQGNIKTQISSLTPQEFAVFTHIYQHNLQETTPSYQQLAQEFGLSESSIRDHVKGLIVKGIPIEKTKHNNKKITLKLAENLQKIASLDALLLLREQNNNIRQTE